MIANYLRRPDGSHNQTNLSFKKKNFKQNEHSASKIREHGHIKAVQFMTGAKKTVTNSRREILECVGSETQ